MRGPSLLLLMLCVPVFAVGCANSSPGNSGGGGGAAGGSAGGTAGGGTAGGGTAGGGGGTPVQDFGPPMYGTGGTWSFDEASGKTASGAALEGAPAWTVGKVNAALHFGGKSDDVATVDPALDNSQSFSVAAWVRLDCTDVPMAILSLDGRTTSAVTLGFWPTSSTGAGGLGIAFPASDSDSAQVTRVVSSFIPVADVWYHLAAVYDSSAHTVQLYVDGSANAQATVPASFSGQAATHIGRGLAGGAGVDYFAGVIDEVRLSPGTLAASDVSTLYAAAAATTPVRPPAVPLIVRGPYVSTWMAADNTAGNWPTFWTGAVKAITGIVRVDGKAYLLIGAPTGITSNATQVSLEITATQSRYVYAAGGMHVYVDFVSPVEATDSKKLSMPFGFINVQAVSVDGNAHDTSFYFDISGEWAHGDSTQNIGWTRNDVAATPSTVSAFAVTPSSPTQFGESNDYASWGTAVFATATTGIKYQSGADTTVRPLFIGGGSLANTIDTVQPRPINQNWPVFAYESDLGMVSGTPSASRTFVLGNVRQPAGNYQGAPLPPLWQAYWPTWQAMLTDAYADAVGGTLVQRADALDDKVSEDAVAAGGWHYAGLCALALRQAFGGVELVNTGADPWMYLKEISSDGNLSTVDVIYPAMPAYLYANPLLLRYLLEPLLIYGENTTLWQQPFAEHDLGAHYPIGDGHNAGTDSSQPLGGGENMPVEESANMLIMTGAYLKYANSPDATMFVNSHYTILKKWADYLVANALDPGSQNQTDDFTGFIAHSSNLALKGILGLGAMAQISTAVGQTTDANNYKTTSQSYITQWSQKSQDSTMTHLKLAYDGDDTTWSLKYNSYPDRLLGLGLIPAATLAEETTWYAQQKAAYGYPLDSRHTYTKADWEMWMAAGVGDPALRQNVVDALYHFANATPSRVPMTDWYDTVAGTQNGFQARPVIGGLFSLMTLGN